MSLLSFTLSVILYSQSSFADSVTCKIQINKTNDRQIDIVLPTGNLISVVGHRHPIRQSGAFDTESALPAILALTKDELAKNLAKDPSWPQKINQAIRNESAAVELLSDDYKHLETYLEQNRYVGVGIEAPVERLNWNAENSARMIENTKFAFAMLKVEPDLKRSYKLLALTPEFLLKQERPLLFKGKQIFTAEPTQKEIDNYDKQICSKAPKPLLPNEYSSFAEFSSSIRDRLPDKASELESFFARSNSVDDKLLSVNPLLRSVRFKPEELTTETLKLLPIKVTENERKLLTTYFEIKLQKAGLFEGCSARDALIVKNLLNRADKGSVINFIGANHLPTLAHYLTEECNKLMNNKAPVKKVPPVRMTR